MALNIINEAGGQWHGKKTVYESGDLTSPTAIQEQITCELFNSFYNDHNGDKNMLNLPKGAKGKDDFTEFGNWLRSEVFPKVGGDGWESHKLFAKVSDGSWIQSYYYQLVSFNMWFNDWKKKTGAGNAKYTFIHHDTYMKDMSTVAGQTQYMANVNKTKKDVIQKADIYAVKDGFDATTFFKSATEDDSPYKLPDCIQWFTNAIDKGDFVGISLKKLAGEAPLAHVLNLHYEMITDEEGNKTTDNEASNISGSNGLVQTVSDIHISGEDFFTMAKGDAGIKHFSNYGEDTISDDLIYSTGTTSTELIYTLQEMLTAASGDEETQKQDVGTRTCKLNIRSAGKNVLVDMFQDGNMLFGTEKLTTPKAHIGSIMYYITGNVIEENDDEEPSGNLNDLIKNLQKSTFYNADKDIFDKWFTNYNSSEIEALDKEMLKVSEAIGNVKFSAICDGLSFGKGSVKDAGAMRDKDGLFKDKIIQQLHDKLVAANISHTMLDTQALLMTYRWYVCAKKIINIYLMINSYLDQKSEEIYNTKLDALKSILYEYYLESKGINHAFSLAAHAPYLYLGN